MSKSEEIKMKYCSKCGKELLDEAVICIGCGCAIENITTKPTEKKTCKPKFKFCINYDLFLHMFFSVISFVLLFVEYFCGEYDGTVRCVGAFVNIFNDLYEGETVNFAILIAMVMYGIFVLCNIIFSFLEFFKKRNYGIIKIICSVSMITFVVNSIISYLSFKNTFVMFWFYVEIVVLIFTVIISILNTFGIYILKKKETNK